MERKHTPGIVVVESVIGLRELIEERNLNTPREGELVLHWFRNRLQRKANKSPSRTFLLVSILSSTPFEHRERFVIL